MLCSLLPFPLWRQNIPDGCNIPYYPLNIQFPAPNAPNSEHTHPPATSGIVVIYLLVPPTPCSTPPLYYTPPPSHPAPSAYPIPYLLTQKTLPAHSKDPICHPNKPRLSGIHPDLLCFLGGGISPIYIDHV